MIICVNGVKREAITEELAELKRLAEYERLASELPPPEPTPDERIAALEEQLKAAKILLGVE